MVAKYIDKTEPGNTEFGDLVRGNWFICPFNGGVYMKIGEDMVVNINGETLMFSATREIEPIEVEIVRVK